jgi:hypothetical protein
MVRNMKCFICLDDEIPQEQYHFSCSTCHFTACFDCMICYARMKLLDDSAGNRQVTCPQCRTILTGDEKDPLWSTLNDDTINVLVDEDGESAWSDSSPVLSTSFCSCCHSDGERTESERGTESDEETTIDECSDDEVANSFRIYLTEPLSEISPEDVLGREWETDSENEWETDNEGDSDISDIDS